MADCESHQCVKRFFRFAMTAAEYRVDWGDSELHRADGSVEKVYAWTSLNPEERQAAKKAVDAALKKREGEGKPLEKCPGGCRCPTATRPPDGDPAWTKTPDEQSYRTAFRTDTSSFTVHYKVFEFTADVTQRCKDVEEEILWIPSQQALLALGPDRLNAALEDSASKRSGGRAARPRATRGAKKGA